MPKKKKNAKCLGCLLDRAGDGYCSEGCRMEFLNERTPMFPCRLCGQEELLHNLNPGAECRACHPPHRHFLVEVLIETKNILKMLLQCLKEK